MRRHPVLFILVLVAVGSLLSACGEGKPPPAPAPTFALATDRNAYVATCTGDNINLWCTFTVEATYHNRTDAPVYLYRCYPDSDVPIFGIGTTDGTEEAAYNPVWACVGHDNHIRVEPGERRVDVLELFGPVSSDGITGEPFGVFEGTFQLGYDAYPCAEEGGCERLPEAQRLSAPFSVTTN